MNSDFVFISIFIGGALAVSQWQLVTIQNENGNKVAIVHHGSHAHRQRPRNNTESMKAEIRKPEKNEKYQPAGNILMRTLSSGCGCTNQ